MKKECSIWHLNFMRQLEAGSMLWRWKPHWAFNRRFLLSVTPTSQQVTVRYMAYKHTKWPRWACKDLYWHGGAITSQFWNFYYYFFSPDKQDYFTDVTQTEETHVCKWQLRNHFNGVMEKLLNL
jgi:hypothetical protein